MDYVAYKYNNFGWIELVRKKNEAEGDYKIQFIHPHGPSQNFSWPTREDVFWVLSNHVLCPIDPPFTTNVNGYKISETD